MFPFSIASPEWTHPFLNQFYIIEDCHELLRTLNSDENMPYKKRVSPLVIDNLSLSPMGEKEFNCLAGSDILVTLSIDSNDQKQITVKD